MKDLSRLTLEERTGQLFFLGFHGAEVDRETREVLDIIRPGGIVLSQRNLENFPQATRLTTSFVEGREVPALVAVHQEGGTADRLKHLFAPLPGMATAAGNGTAALRQLARIVAMELQATGFNTLFGPVLDLASAGSILRERALAASPASVTRLGRAFVEEVAAEGIFVCAKHFPGLGTARQDPHFALPSIDKPKKLLLVEDVPPFVNLFDMLPMIMVGHGSYSGLGEAKPTPASLSTRIVTGLLRRKLGFRGIVVTDDMTMGAITRTGLTADRFLEALEAGNDMIVFSQATPLAAEAFWKIVNAAKRSAGLRANIDAAAERILALKLRLPLPAHNRAQIRTRVLRHIDRLTKTVEVVPAET